MKKIGSCFVCLLFCTLACSSLVTALEEDADVSQEAFDKTAEFGDRIAFDGTCNLFFHFRYRTCSDSLINPTEKIVRTGFTMIVFQDSDISINGERIDQKNSGMMFLFHYVGDYDLDYDDHSLLIDGRAWIVKVI